MAVKTLPGERDLLIRLLDRVDFAIAAAARLHLWLKQRLDEELGNWDECVEMKLADDEVFCRLSAWGISIEGWEERLNELTDQLSVNRGPLLDYLPGDHVPPQQKNKHSISGSNLSHLEVRVEAVTLWTCFTEEIDRQRRQLEELKTSIANQLQNVVLLERYLDLVVDPVSGVVRRDIAQYRGRIVQLRPKTAELHTLCVAIKARDQGASPEEWEKGYPTKWEARRKVKKRLSDKLQELGLGLYDGSILRLKEI